MVTGDANYASGSSSQRSPDQVALQASDAPEPVTVLNCSRIGLIANPPQFSVPDWLRVRRRR